MARGAGHGEKVWEGRGEGVANARKAETAGRAADDLRLTGLHLRILLHVGRQNANRGWLRLSQQELGKAWRVSRSRLSTAVNDLAEMLYLDKLGQSATGESFCHYRIRLDDDAGTGPYRGEPLWIEPGEAVDGVPAAAQEGHGSPENEGVFPGGNTPGVFPGGNTSVPARGNTSVPTQGTHNRLSPTNTEDSPPPPEGGRAGGTRTRKRAEAGPRWAAAVLARLLAEPRHEVAAKLLTPLCRLLDPPKSGDGEAWCEHLARRLVDTPGPVLSAAADALLDVQGHRVPPVPAVLEAVKAAAAASRVGADVVVKRGSAEHAAWVSYERAAAGKSASWEPQWARHEVWGKPTRWPPGHEPATAPAPAAAAAADKPRPSITIPPRDPRWEAWRLWWIQHPAMMPAQRLAALGRGPFQAPADWPTGSPDVSEHNGGWHIPADTPEQAAWLAHMRRTDPAAAQAAALGHRALTRPSRWPPIPAAEPAPTTTHATATPEPRP